MKIEIKDNKDVLTLSNDRLDNDNFVELYLDSDEDNCVATMTIPIEELLSAITTFHQLRSLRIEREKSYE